MEAPAERAAPRAYALSPTLFRRLAVASAVSLWVVISTGATVRLTGSGLGCEGWPGCAPGAVFPEKDYHSFVEFGNRVVSLVPIVLSLATAAASHVLRPLPRWTRAVAWATAIGTLAQAPLGLLTVRLELHPLAVASHFLLAVAVLAGAVVVAVEARRAEVGNAGREVPRRVARLALAFAAWTLGVVVTGVLVTAAGPHAGDADVVDRFGNFERAVWLHVRVTAVFGIALLALVWYLHGRGARVRRVAYVLLGLVATQAVVGEVQFRTGLPWWIVLVHVALAAAIWAVTVLLATLLWRPTADSDAT